MNRLIGIDFARALALFGMVIVNFKLAMNADIGTPQLIEFAALLEGRASALFVILAGIGIALLTKKMCNQWLNGTHKASKNLFDKKVCFTTFDWLGFYFYLGSRHLEILCILFF